MSTLYYNKQHVYHKIYNVMYIINITKINKWKYFILTMILLLLVYNVFSGVSHLLCSVFVNVICNTLWGCQYSQHILFYSAVYDVSCPQRVHFCCNNSDLTSFGRWTRFSSTASTCLSLSSLFPSLCVSLSAQVIRVMIRDSLRSVAQYQSLHWLTVRYLYNRIKSALAVRQLSPGIQFAIIRQHQSKGSVTIFRWLGPRMLLKGGVGCFPLLLFLALPVFVS